MNLPDLKQLTKLINLCRKLGIVHVKLGDAEFSLSDSAPSKKTRSRKANKTTATSTTEAEDDEINTDSLSDEELLLWSAGAGINFESETQGN